MTSPDRTLRADAVVVGSGAGGAPVAATLAEAGREVLVLEAGPRLDTADFGGDDPGARLMQIFTNQSASDSGMAVFAGACVGGSTVVNDALCWPVPPEVLDQWRREHGLGSLTETGFAPWVDAVWREIHASPTGPVNTSKNMQRLARAAEARGWSHQPMHRNVRSCANVGQCNFGCPTGAKQSMALTYLPRAERAGARVLAGTCAERVVIEAGRVRAVDARESDGGLLRIETPRVCLAAGVLATPALLLRSGVANAGADLQFHTSLYVTARFAEPIHPYYGPTMGWAVTEFADVLGHTGPGFMLESVGMHPTNAALGLPGFGEALARTLETLPHLARTIVVLRDRTRGRVRLDGETVRLDYAPVPGDLARLRQGLREMGSAYLESGAEAVYLPIHDSHVIASYAELDRALERELTPSHFASLYAVHLFGGAAMGGTRAGSVCDESGRVWDVAGLHVADASALPGNTGVNPQVTIMANALRIAAGMVEETE